MGENIISVESIVNQAMAILEQHRTKIEDVFYEYKHNDDLTFSFWFDFPEPAEALEIELSKIPYVEVGVRETNHVMHNTGRSVDLTLPNLEAKELFTEALRKGMWCANGG